MLNNFFLSKILPSMRYCKKCWPGQATVDNIIWRIRFASWVSKAIDTHLEYVTHSAFPWRQWLRERPQCYVYAYIACLIVDSDSCLLTFTRTTFLRFNFYQVSVTRYSMNVAWVRILCSFAGKFNQFVFDLFLGETVLHYTLFGSLLRFSGTQLLH
jgi:hypothetical protein